MLEAEGISLEEVAERLGFSVTPLSKKIVTETVTKQPKKENKGGKKIYKEREFRTKEEAEQEDAFVKNLVTKGYKYKEANQFFERAFNKQLSSYRYYTIKDKMKK